LDPANVAGQFLIQTPAHVLDGVEACGDDIHRPGCKTARLIDQQRLLPLQNRRQPDGQPGKRIPGGRVIEQVQEGCFLFERLDRGQQGAKCFLAA
jgi:hypothetical protein